MKILKYIVFLVSLITGLSSKAFDGNIPTDPGLSQSVVGIYVGENLLCTGVVWDDASIITAKHCMAKINTHKQLRALRVAGQAGSRVLEVFDHSKFDISILKTTTMNVERRFKGIYSSPLVSGDNVLIGGLDVDKNIVFGETGVRLSEGELTEIEEGPIYLCNGDSGAPVFLKDDSDQYYLAGIVIRGEEGCYGKGIFLNFSSI